jgi:hypothetical protein
MTKKTSLIYLIGKPGTGKYTIAKELSKSNYIICDNQLINNPIFTLVNYDGYGDIPQSAWDAIAKMRDSLFDFIAKEKNNNYVLTNCLYETPGDLDLFKQVDEMSMHRGSLFIPVKLIIDEQEHLKRITNPVRTERLKSIDPKDIYGETPLLTINHPNFLELDVTNLSASDAAKEILTHLANFMND